MTQEELSRLFHKHYHELYTYTSRRIPSMYAHDVVADAFIQTYNTWSESGGATVYTYLRACIKNKCVDILRMASFRKMVELTPDIEISESNRDISEMLSSKIQTYKIIRAIDALPPQMRIIVMLSLFEDASPADIATKMGISYQTVRNTKTRALEKLRSTIKLHI